MSYYRPSEKELKVASVSYYYTVFSMAILSTFVTDAKLLYEKFYKFGSAHKGTYYELPEGPEEWFGPGARDSLDVNWLSIEDLAYNEEHFTEDQQRRMAAILNTDLHRGVIGRKNVLNSLLASAAGGKNYAKVCLCCTKANHSISSLAFVSCDNWRYCEKCASRKRQRYFKHYYYRFENPIGPTNFYHVTLTPKDKLEYTTENYQEVSNVWDHLNKIVDSMQKEGLIDGGLIVEEMSVDQLYPKVVVNPHIHMICTSANELVLPDRPDAEVKIHIKKVEDKEQFRNLINYLPKAIDLTEVYTETWTKETSRTVNNNLREVMTGYRELFNDRKHTRVFGRFHGTHSNSIVVSVEDYQRYKLLDPDAKKSAKAKTKKKSACKYAEKKIKCVKVEKPKKKMLPPVQPIKKEEPKKFGLGKFLGLSALGGLGALGAYHYGRSGDNFLSGAANAVHDNVVSPAIQTAEPHLQKFFPSLGNSIKQKYDTALSNRLNLGELKGYIDYAGKHPTSALQGTPFEQFNPDQLSTLGNKIQSSPYLAGSLLGSMGIPVAADLAGKMGINEAVKNVSPGLMGGLSSVAKYAPKVTGLLSALTSVGDASQLANWWSDKNQATGWEAGLTKGLGTMTGMAAAGAGAAAGLRVPGPPVVKAVAAGLGGSILPIANTIRKGYNNIDLRESGFQSRQQALIDTLKEALQSKERYGNENLLNSWRSQAGNLTDLAAATSDPAVRQQILALQ